MKILAITFIAALALRTLGALDPFGGKVYLPSPRGYVATWLLWFVLGLAAAVGPRASRLAGQLSALVVLTMLVTGSSGRKLVSFLNASAGGDLAAGLTAAKGVPA